MTYDKKSRATNKLKITEDILIATKEQKRTTTIKHQHYSPWEGRPRQDLLKDNDGRTKGMLVLFICLEVELSSLVYGWPLP